MAEPPSRKIKPGDGWAGGAEQGVADSVDLGIGNICQPLMRIPIFVSAPTVLSKAQEAVRRHIQREVERMGLEQRALGRSDYPTELPLREVVTIARHCAGGIILGFSQFRASAGVWKPETPQAEAFGEPVYFPSPWNQIEAGVLSSLGLPLLVFKEKGISGGVFDHGVSDVFIHPMPSVSACRKEQNALRAVFLKWQTSVRNQYYR